MAKKLPSYINANGQVQNLFRKVIEPAMFKNYFKTATRNLSKNKFFTTLNVFGLALGMSLNLLWVAMVVFIYQFDNFHPNKKQIYRIITTCATGTRTRRSHRYPSVLLNC